MGRKGSRVTEQRLIPFQAAQHVAYSYDRPYSRHRVPSLSSHFRTSTPLASNHPQRVRAGGGLGSLGLYGSPVRQTATVSDWANSNVRFTDRAPTGRVRWRTPRGIVSNWQ